MILSLGRAGRLLYDLFSSHVHHSLPDTYVVTSFALSLSTNLDPGVFLPRIATARTRNGPYLFIQKFFAHEMKPALQVIHERSPPSLLCGLPLSLL